MYWYIHMYLVVLPVMKQTIRSGMRADQLTLPRRLWDLDLAGGGVGSLKPMTRFSHLPKIARIHEPFEQKFILRCRLAAVLRGVCKPQYGADNTSHPPSLQTSASTKNKPA